MRRKAQHGAGGVGCGYNLLEFYFWDEVFLGLLGLDERFGTRPGLFVERHDDPAATLR